MDFKEYWEQINHKNAELNSLYSSYWNKFSDFGDWQFWVVIALMLLPLILLCIFVDRNRIFELFFFGYTVHVLWNYVDIALGRSGYLVHTYFLTHLLPNATNMTASVLPVCFLFLYQYCSKQNKNFYLFSLLLSAAFAFGYALLEESLGFTQYKKGMNQFYIFLIDIGIAYIAYWFTKLLVKVKSKAIK
ncbi:hypothetical protein JOC77_000876 [Peribacillus deserti]|uniref:Uncharacterized protein n=1 Tax=Peribacillus deserti TaxID=673318 RepID=A0ABS2QE91_9BACI|nr:hypothetical protein [Peribacillus deserti]